MARDNRKASLCILMLLSVTAAGCSLVKPGSAYGWGTQANDSRQDYSVPVNNIFKPGIAEVTFSGISRDKIEKQAGIEAIDSKNSPHSGVVGLIGLPIDLSYDDVEEPEICFTYVEKYLGSVPEKNLLMLHYNETGGLYDIVNGFVLDEEQNMISAPITEGGVYLLADAYQWYSAWGIDTSGYEYDIDPMKTVSTWERQEDTGSIMQLADKKWAFANAPDFHVSTPEELASAVYYINSFSEGEKYQIILEDDIDLSGYAWRPIGWTSGGFGESHKFFGTIDGQNHTISGMTIELGYVDCGFIGYGSGVEMRDITFAAANVSGTACTGIAGGEIYGHGIWENVKTIGIVSGGDENYGGIVGRETDITFKGCLARTIVNGEEFPWFSYRQKILEETEVIETFNLTLNEDLTVTRDEHEGFDNLGWEILLDGVHVLQRGADHELILDTEYQWLDGEHGTHTIYLVAYINGTYIRVSNIIEYTN